MERERDREQGEREAERALHAAQQSEESEVRKVEVGKHLATIDHLRAEIARLEGLDALRYNRALLQVL